MACDCRTVEFSYRAPQAGLYSSRRVGRGWDFLEPFPAHSGAVCTEALLPGLCRLPPPVRTEAWLLLHTDAESLLWEALPWRPSTRLLLFLEAHSPVWGAANGRNYPLSSSDNYSSPSDAAFVLEVLEEGAQ